MKHIINVSLIVTFISIITSCEKEKILEKQYSWKLFDKFLYEEKIRMNSFEDGERMYTIGPGSFSTSKVESNDSNQINVERAILYFNYPIKYKTPITSRIFAGLDFSNVIFFSTNNPTLFDSHVFITIPEIDPTFAYFDLPDYWMSECFVFNEKHQCLIPYQSYDTTYHDNKIVPSEPKFIIAQLSVNNDGVSDYIDTVSCSSIETGGGLGGLSSLHSIDEYFFVTGWDKTIRISPNSEIETIFNGRLYKIFKFNGKLYGFTYSELYSSIDSGLSWQIFGQVDPDLWKVCYKTIGNELIGYYNSQLFHLIITDNNLAVKEIINDGLEGNKITSVSYFKGKVYVTTLSGIFGKSFDKFFEYKVN